LHFAKRLLLYFMIFSTSAPATEEEAGKNYWSPATPKGTRSPNMLHMFLSFWVVSLLSIIQI